MYNNVDKKIKINKFTGIVKIAENRCQTLRRTAGMTVYVISRGTYENLSFFYAAQIIRDRLRNIVIKDR